MKKILTLLMITGLVWSTQIQAQVSISTTCDDPDASAMLDVQSTTMGFLPPRVADTTTINTPAEGLIAYDLSEHCLRYFNGTKWSNCIACTTCANANEAPVASNVSISGTLEEGQVLTGSYTYSDAENDPEGTSTFQWYRADDASGTNQVAISGATSSTYTLQNADVGYYISYEVTPVAQTGTSPGTAVLSSYQGPVTSSSPSTTACGATYTYNDVTNPSTGDTWLDKNLEAEQVATSSDDYQAYGSLYQWGRLSDDHQCIAWTNSTSGTPAQDTTHTLSTTDTPSNAKFILHQDGTYDWRNPQNDNLWQGVNGTNNPCPNGYRIPTSTELNDERNSWASNDANGAYGSPLKLSVAGQRRYDNGNLYSTGSTGSYWSSTLYDDYACDLYFSSSSAGISNGGKRSTGFSVRCIKDASFTCGSNISDIDGNSYPTVQIDSQCWMAADLKVTHYPNGDAIPNITDGDDWANLSDNNTDDAYCFYNNTNDPDYGALYTYAAAIGDNWLRDNNANQGICPDGWHIASDAEWTTLENNCGGGGGAKETGTVHWNSPNTNATNSSGFTALPTGSRADTTDGAFGSRGDYGLWWTATEYDSSSSHIRRMDYDNGQMHHFVATKSRGFSVRCLQD
jgi:uncharacterized protein (TIGR02145 family)